MAKKTKYVLIREYPGTRLQLGEIATFKGKHKQGFCFVAETPNINGGQTYIREKHVKNNTFWRAV